MAGLIGTMLLVLLAPYIVKVALASAPPTTSRSCCWPAVTAVLGISRIRGFASLAIGLTIGLIGIDQQTGQQRLTFGIPQLADGIDVVVVAVGIFAIGEALWVAAHLRRRPAEIIPTGRAFMSREDLRQSWKPWLRGHGCRACRSALLAVRPRSTFLSYVTEAAVQAQGGVRQGRDRGRRRAGGQQQRLGRGDAGPDAHPGLPTSDRGGW